MMRRHPRSPRPDTLFPYPTLVLSRTRFQPSSQYSRCQARGGATPTLAPAGWSAKNQIRLPVSVTGRCQRYSIHGRAGFLPVQLPHIRSEEHTSELQSLMRSTYAVFCLTKTIETPELPTIITV